MPASTHLRASWHTDLLEMVVLPSTGASRYHNYCIDGGTSPGCFGYPSYLKKTFRIKYFKYIHLIKLESSIYIYLLFSSRL
jgi:hypothetical protein